MIRYCVNVFDIDAAAKYIAENNFSLKGSYSEKYFGVKEDIMNTIQRMIDKNEWYSGTAGWTVQKFEEDTDYFIFEITVSPHFGEHHYIDFETL